MRIPAGRGTHPPQMMRAAVSDDQLQPDVKPDDRPRRCPPSDGSDTRVKMRALRWSDLGSSAVADLAPVAGPSGTRSAARGEVAHSRALPRRQVDEQWRTDTDRAVHPVGQAPDVS